MKHGFSVAVVGLGLLAAEVPLAAQYSFLGTYDDTKPVKFTGVIAQVEWRNPHSYVYLDVKSADGDSVRWVLDLAGGGLLGTRGLTRTSFKPGDFITVEGFVARSEQHRAYSRIIMLPDGKELNTEPETVWGGCRTVAASLVPVSQYPPSAVLQGRVCASVVH